MSTTPKNIESMSLADLEAIVAKKKQTEIDVLKTEISALEDTLTKKREALAKLTGEPTAPAVKRTYKKRGKKNLFNLPKNASTRDKSLKGTILKFLATKGSSGAHVDELVKLTGKKKQNINAFLATTGKKHGIKGKGNRSGIYFLK